MSDHLIPTRCPWVHQGTQSYITYHDEKWGVPVHDDTTHFMMITLESAQAGLSWQTILNKIEGYKACFNQFHIPTVASFSEEKIYALAQDHRIIRNLQKIATTVHNARCFLKLQHKFGSFDHYIWSFVDHTPIINYWQEAMEVPSSTPLAKHITKELKKHGFKFIGPTIIYAYMQAIGMVNDHITSCFRHQELEDKGHV